VRQAAAAAILAVSLSCAAPPEAPRAAAPQAQVSTAPVPASAPQADSALLEKLVGRWNRTDGDYTIEIRAAAADGTLEARYFNPGPIHVARAQATVQDETVTLVLELRDRHYPGNLYTLTYSPAEDVLSGLYSHVGIGQTFDVVFERSRAGR
jgi:hypothetical protein